MIVLVVGYVYWWISDYCYLCVGVFVIVVVVGVAVDFAGFCGVSYLLSLLKCCFANCFMLCVMGLLICCDWLFYCLYAYRLLVYFALIACYVYVVIYVLGC